MNHVKNTTPKGLYRILDYRKEAYFAFAVLIFIYVALRAYLLSFTHDESTSYALISGKSEFVNTANNHLFNTNLMKLFSHLSGDWEFSLRLPNVIAFIVYLVACYYIFKLFRYKWLIIISCSLLILNPFILEFFALARGYGLSTAFLTLSLCFLFKSDFNNLKPGTLNKLFIMSLLTGAIALYSNLISINFYIAVLMIYFYNYFFNLKIHRKISFKVKILIVIVFVAGLVPVYLGVQRLLLLKETAQLYFGSGSFTACIDTIVHFSLYFSSMPLWIKMILRYTIVGLLPLSAILIILNHDFKSHFFTITILNILIFIALITENHLFSTPYPSGRTALLLIPVLALQFCFLFEHINTYFTSKTNLVKIITFLFAGILSIHFFQNVNFTRTITWGYDAYTKNIMKIIEYQTHNSEQKATISNDWLFAPTINYYIATRKINVNFADRNGINLNSDYIYDFGVDKKYESFETIATYPDENTVLFAKQIVQQ